MEIPDIRKANFSLVPYSNGQISTWKERCEFKIGCKTIGITAHQLYAASLGSIDSNDISIINEYEIIMNIGTGNIARSLWNDKRKGIRFNAEECNEFLISAILEYEDPEKIWNKIK